MTKAQKQEALTIIQADCAARSVYLRRTKTDEGTLCETCAIGALAQAAGVSEEVLLLAGATCIGVDADDKDVDLAARVATMQIRNQIYLKFGLLPDQQAIIQRKNDGEAARPHRVHEIMRYLEQLATTD
jgi:hypothetical protein